MGLNKAKGRMFKSVGWTWNPIAGCTHKCKYCWAKSLSDVYGRSFEPQFREHYLKDKMPNDGSWIFVGSMGDIGCEGVQSEWLSKLLDFIENDTSNNIFLLQSKNPSIFYDKKQRLENIKNKIVLGTTLETTEETPWSRAPSTFKRALNLATMKQNYGFRTFLSLEPLSDFNLEKMMSFIEEIQPEAVEIGLENYTNHTTKPPEWKIVALIHWLKEQKIEYVLKENLEHLYNVGTDTVKSSQIGIDIQDG